MNSRCSGESQSLAGLGTARLDNRIENASCAYPVGVKLHAGNIGRTRTLHGWSCVLAYPRNHKRVLLVVKSATCSMTGTAERE